jgi:hypothetical protein
MSAETRRAKPPITCHAISVLLGHFAPEKTTEAVKHPTLLTQAHCCHSTKYTVEVRHLNSRQRSSSSPTWADKRHRHLQAEWPIPNRNRHLNDQTTMQPNDASWPIVANSYAIGESVARMAAHDPEQTATQVDSPGRLLEAIQTSVVQPAATDNRRCSNIVPAISPRRLAGKRLA